MVVPKRSSFLPSARNSMAPARNSMTPARNSMIPSRSSGIIKTKFDNTPLSPTTKAISAETKSKLVVAAVAEENAVEVSDQAAKGSVVPQEPPPVVVSDHIPLPEDHTDQPPVIVSDHIPVSENHTGPEPATAAPAITDPKPESDNLVSKKTGHRPVSSTMANSFLPTSHSLENLFTIVSQFESWDHIYPEADAQSIVVAEEEEEEYLEAPGVVEEQVASVLPDGLENPHNAEDIKEVETQDVVVEKDVITQQEDVAVADLKPDEEIPRLAANPVIKSEESHRGDLKE